MWATGARRGERDGDRAWMEWLRVESDGGDSLSLSTLCCEVNYGPGACCRGASGPLACRCPAIANRGPGAPSTLTDSSLDCGCAPDPAPRQWSGTSSAP